jgi:methyltransferase (TIGR00027 family)
MHADGFQRVAIIGAGFDTLALRLASEFPHIEWMEIDHPATQRAKRSALGGELAPNVRFVAVDLSVDPLPTELFDDGRATLVIAEGVLMYLAPQAIDRLFEAVARLRMPARMVFSFMSKWPDGSAGFLPRSAWVERWLAWRREPFTWSIEPQRLDGFLRRFALAPIEVAPAQQLAADAGTRDSLLAGEDLVLCEKMRA